MADPDPIWSQLLLQVVLILVNAFFAAAEIAVISVNETRVRMQAEEGDKKAKLIVRMRDHSARFLSTIQIGITLAGFLASAFAADNFSDRLVDWLVNGQGFTALSPAALNTVCVILITLVLSYFTIVFGELVPKRIGMKQAERVSRFSVGIIHVMSSIVRPVIWLLSVSTNGMLRLFGIDPKDDEEEVTEEEIRMMVERGGQSGSIETGEQEMIDNIFEFNNTMARDVMTHRTDVCALSLEDTDEEIISAIVSSGLSRYPVYQEDIDDIIGILFARDYLLNAQSAHKKPLADLLRPAYFVPESVRTNVLFADMQQRKMHMSIVVDEYGGTSGIVTMEDLLEEIVGNIYDEYDPLDDEEIQKLEENLYKVSGSVDLELLGEELGMSFLEASEECDCDTLGGLVFSELSTIPEDGATFALDVCGLHVQVTDFSDRRVEWALVSRLEPEPYSSQENSEEKA